MKLLDFFRKKQKRKKLESKPVPAAAPSKEKEAPTPPYGAVGGVGVPTAERVGKKDTAAPKSAPGSSKEAGLILDRPLVTEKSSDLSGKGIYVFRVSSLATKPMVKKAVEELYKVKVSKVNIINIPSRLRRVGRHLGRRRGYKKAVIKLAEGQKIEFV